MKVGDPVKLEVPGEKPKYGHIIRIDLEGRHIGICCHGEEAAKGAFELLAREMVPA